MPEGAGCWNGGETNSPQLYMRVNGEKTVEVSAPEKGVSDSSCPVAEEACHPAIYVGASTDGSKVFFMTQTELTAEAVKLGLHDWELYEYNTDAGEGEAALVRVSRGESAEGKPGGVGSVPAVAGDGAAVYFNSGDELVHHSGGGGGLYRYDTSTGTTAYVAPSPGYPNHVPTEGFAWYESELGALAGLDLKAGYYTTGNGDFLVFASSQDVTGYDSNGQEELYRYSYEPESPSGGGVVCVSCDPNGARPSYSASFTRSAVRGDNPAGAPPRPISEDGRYVFFDTTESLVPADTNGKLDVYEWEREGAGGCAAGSGGCISLITTGQDTRDSFFLDSSPDGRNVFFGTHSHLVAADKDEQGDLYDARVEGGFPQPLGVGPCEGDACHHPPAAPPEPPLTLLPSPGPASPLGTATAKPKPAAGKCHKGFVKKKVKKKTECVKSKTAKKSDRGRAK